MRFGMVGDVAVDNRAPSVAWRHDGGWIGEVLRKKRDICVILSPYVEVRVRFHALGGNGWQCLSERKISLPKAVSSNVTHQGIAEAK